MLEKKPSILLDIVEEILIQELKNNLLPEIASECVVMLIKEPVFEKVTYHQSYSTDKAKNLLKSTEYNPNEKKWYFLTFLKKFQI